jgi:hypothetical protein
MSSRFGDSGWHPSDGSVAHNARASSQLDRRLLRDREWAAACVSIMRLGNRKASNRSPQVVF